jgi:ribosomal protein S6--L-glutamate ligase/gamma-F420-2:alpha-L-glutamate ligase
MLGVKSFNSSSAISVCDNKILTYLALKDKVALPKTIVAPKTFEGINYSDTSFISDAIALLNTPFIIKEACGSFGKQVYLANDLAEAENIVKNLNYKEFLMQEFIKTSIGKDVRINVVGGKVVSAILRTNENDFRSNISNGGKGANYTPTKKEADLAIKVTNLLGLDFSGVDVLFGENDTPILCEVNSNPHFKSSLDITGVDMGEEIIKYIIGKLK